MRDLADTLVEHEVRGRRSCVSWGLELVAKLHEQMALPDYSIQERFPEGLGFGADGQDILAGYNVKAEEFSLLSEDFKNVCAEEVRLGFPPLVSLITIAEVIFHPFGFNKSKHVFCATLHENRLYFLTRVYGHEEVFNFTLPEVMVLFKLSSVIERGYRFHVLKHRPIGIRF